MNTIKEYAPCLLWSAWMLSVLFYVWPLFIPPVVFIVCQAYVWSNMTPKKRAENASEIRNLFRSV